MKPAAAAQPGTFTGRHMAILVISFFGVIISVNIGMAVISSVSWTGLVVDNSYIASQEFEEKRLAHEAQLAAGWQSSFSHADGTARLIVADAANWTAEQIPPSFRPSVPIAPPSPSTRAIDLLQAVPLGRQQPKP